MHYTVLSWLFVLIIDVQIWVGAQIEVMTMARVTMQDAYYNYIKLDISIS